MRQIKILTTVAFLTLFVRLSHGQDYLNWAITLGSMTEEIANDMVVDDDENIYIVGELHGPVNMNPTGNFSISPPVGNLGVYVAKYDKTGAFVWAKALDADSGSEITLSESGSVLVTGTFTDTATFGTTIVKNTLSSTVSTIYIASFDKDTGAFEGAGVIEGTGDQEPLDIKPSGTSLLIAGSYKGTADFDITGGQSNLTQSGNVNNLFIAKYANQGGLTWVKSIASNSPSNTIDDIETDALGNVYAVGRLWETLDFQNGTNLNGAVGMRPESFIFKLESDASFKWDRVGSHSGSLDRSGYLSLELDQNGDLTIAGFIQGTVTLGGFNTTTVSVDSSPNILVVKYDPTGSPRTVSVLGGDDEQFALTHALDAQGNYIIAGVAKGPGNDFDPDPNGTTSLPFSTVNQFDIFVAKYNSDLSFQWAGGFIGSTIGDWAHTVAASPGGNIYVSGYVEEDVDFDFDATNVQKNGISGGRDLYIASLHNVAVHNQRINLCDGSTVQVGNSTYSAVGTYQDIFTGGRATGQDSVVNTTILSLLDPITLTATPTSPTCFGGNDGTVTINASDAATRDYEYSINGITSQTSPTFTSLVAGTHTAWVRDKDGCIASINFQIQAATEITANANISHVLCNGEQNGSIALTASGGTGPYTYSLDGGSFGTSASFNQLTAGTYSITIKDTKGCVGTVSITVTEPDALQLFEDTLINPGCAGEATGLLDVAALGGSGPYEYSIDGANFVTSNIFDNLAAGSYTITVRDASNCTATLSRTLTQPTILVAQGVSFTHVDCRGAANGSVTITGQGGTPGTTGYQYKIDEGNYQSSGTFTGLLAGGYTLTVKDENGCTSTTSIDINEPAPFSLTTTQVNITCKGDDNGFIEITGVTGGTAPYEYALDGGTYSSTSTFRDLAPGSYTVSVKDANGCLTNKVFEITEPDQLETQIASVSQVLCAGSNTGSLTLTASGGTGDITYSLDGTNFQAQSSFTGLTAGDYTVTVKDAVSCEVTINTTVTEPTALNLAFEQVNVTCSGADNGQIAGAASGGVGPYSYSLDGTNFQTTIFDNLAPGDYTLTVRDDNSCTAATNVTITEPLVFVVNAQKTDVTCRGADDGTITLFASGGTTGGGTIYINNVQSSSSSFSGLAPGTYDFRVLDANMCEVTLTVNILEPDELTVTAAATHVTCNGDADGGIALTGAGGTAPYEYSLDGTSFQSAASFTSLAPEIYTITIRDANGCTGTASATITEPDALAVTVNLSNFNTITASASGGTAPYEYAIDGTFQSSGTFSNLGNGNYTVTARDANGCTVAATQALVVTSVDEPLLTPIIKSYPNPARDYILISEVAGGDVIRLVSLSGKTMGQTEIKKAATDYKQDISTMTEALFVLVITDKSGRRKLRQKVMRVK
ncbi:MAG: hypothetical protein HEP71_32850 [Roseivirga sp.]|nr:hypothetical protein [Roseivirga sp.]